MFLFVRTCIHVHNLKQHPQKYLPFLREGLEAYQLDQTGKIAKPGIFLLLLPQSWYLCVCYQGHHFYMAWSKLGPRIDKADTLLSYLFSPLSVFFISFPSSTSVSKNFSTFTSSQ